MADKKSRQKDVHQKNLEDSYNIGSLEKEKEGAKAKEVAEREDKPRFTKGISLYWTEDQYRRLKNASRENGLTVASYIRVTMIKSMEKDGF